MSHPGSEPDRDALLASAHVGLAVAVELCAIFDRHATETGVFEDADEMINDLERFELHEKLTEFISMARGQAPTNPERDLHHG